MAAVADAVTVPAGGGGGGGGDEPAVVVFSIGSSQHTRMQCAGICEPSWAEIWPKTSSLNLSKPNSLYCWHIYRAVTMYLTLRICPLCLVSLVDMTESCSV